MKRPSNLIITFISAIAGIFLAYAVGRIALRLLSPPEIEIEEDLPRSSLQSGIIKARKTVILLDSERSHLQVIISN